MVTGLCASGLPTDAFVFLGFTPKRKGKRKELLASLAVEPRTLIFYESPRRVSVFLDEVRAVMGDRRAVLAREMTKLHEEFIRGTLSEILIVLADRPEVKGECTLMVEGAAASDSVSTADLADALRAALGQPGARLSGLSKAFARQYQLPRKTVYEMALSIQKETDASD